MLASACTALGRNLRCDVAIVGGGFGGCAAAIAALRNGMRVVLTEETDWIGGQVTSQIVPPDEHPWVNSPAARGLTASIAMGSASITGVTIL